MQREAIKYSDIEAKSLYLIISTELESMSSISGIKLSNLTERHVVNLDKPLLEIIPKEVGIASLKKVFVKNKYAGIIFELNLGYPKHQTLRLVGWALRNHIAAYFYWPSESVIEVIDKARLKSYWNLKTCAIMYRLFNKYNPSQNFNVLNSIDLVINQVRNLRKKVDPIPLNSKFIGNKIEGMGAYLRTDYWAIINSGGSYGHTCYVAKELADITESFICLMSSDFSLLTDLGLKQYVLPKPFETCNEIDLLQATTHYYEIIKKDLFKTKPTYIYERLCLGNYVGALLSIELKIPYIVEYNGSEVSMMKSFGSKGYEYADLFEEIEELAFHQATAISVVSSVVAESLIKRGVPEHKILINPNGADPREYAPMPLSDRLELRRSLGFQETDRVIGFVATFGGWHGIDVLAEAIPKVCQQFKDARWLLIGDGTHKHLVDKVILDYQLQDKVVMSGRVSQKEGARLLKACDLYVSPHSCHMVDSRFFGSPTKLFEYMSLGKGIVASDLEQIGEVLSPALKIQDFEKGVPFISEERAVLCKPGDVTEFVQGTLALLQHSTVSDTLGCNARQAILDNYSWQCHVKRLWDFIRNSPGKSNREYTVIETEDAFKDEVQNQWNNDPCGSHYVKNATKHSLEWYLEAEQYRYGKYAPWMLEVMEFKKHAGKKLLEIGAGMGTDLAQFAKHGANVTDYDLSITHLTLAQENFKLRGLKGDFHHGDAEELPFENNTFDVVYSNGVIHHTPNTEHVISEIYRVLKPGGKAIIMVYAENSLHYWFRIVYEIGLKQGKLFNHSIGAIMSSSVELSENKAKPLVKVYSKASLRKMFNKFNQISIVKRQMTPEEVPDWLQWVPVKILERIIGWNLIIKAYKPI